MANPEATRRADVVRMDDSLLFAGVDVPPRTLQYVPDNGRPGSASRIGLTTNSNQTYRRAEVWCGDVLIDGGS